MHPGQQGPRRAAHPWTRSPAFLGLALPFPGRSIHPGPRPRGPENRQWTKIAEWPVEGRCHWPGTKSHATPTKLGDQLHKAVRRHEGPVQTPRGKRRRRQNTRAFGFEGERGGEERTGQDGLEERQGPGLNKSPQI
ncbi:uncharacterized protein BP5553_05225 [Venustampulla echinocandica]|uniref:Uncharacterized protein n=1 Tax=Venustampulla echinocandica TaxID=2656787 RepID=A0A370TQK2_9HELO|nr:uncharacterized protein BP5553_05225 [Venustampulla echinocandica]RDL37792.1 hypothetical protein BP5553_05225 [Venustampulla echinocandica]